MLPLLHSFPHQLFSLHHISPSITDKFIIMPSSSSSIIHHKTKSINNMKQPFLLLKDYLKDDFSSCSSNGFKSFPRKQQSSNTTSVRFLIDLDLHSSINSHHFKTTKNSSSSISVLQRASRVLLSAVKLLPFSTTSLAGSTTSNNNHKSSSSSSSSCSNNKKGVLTKKSFSRKVLKRIFWKKSKDEEGRSFSEFLDEKELRQKPCDTITITTTTSSGGTLSDTSNSWPGSEFTWAECLQASSSGDFNNVVCEFESPEKKKKSCTIVVAESREEATTTSYSVEANAKIQEEQRPTKEEKEQFSPVSVLDCPFDDEDEDEDEDEETCSPFRHRLAQLEGKAKKLKKKLTRFENLSEVVEPIELEKRMMTLTSSVDTTTSMFISIEKEVKREEKGEDLLNIIKTRIPSNSLLKLKPNNTLLIDLFKESIIDEELWDEGDAMKVAEDWANGKANEVILDWQVREGRQVYIRDMEERGQWRTMKEDDRDMTQRVGFEIEVGVWSFLVDELVSDLCAS